jgi:hypothetical protein
MASQDNRAPLKITLDDIANVAVPEAAVILPAQPSMGAKSYGTINQAAEQFIAVEDRGSILLQGWFYLGIAGLVGALAGWGIAEPGFVDGRGSERWGNLILLPLIITLMCFAFAMAESLVERSLHKAVLRGVLALPLGLILGFFFEFGANIIYSIGLNICYAAGAQNYRNPAVWIARGIAWMVFGAAGGLIYGIIGQSMKKGYYGVIGGVIGAGLGGILFDPIAVFTKGGAPSRAIGFALFGIATGVGMGLVESALKDRWLYVMAGPLAGKQFILYKSLTTIGSRQQSDIYLFKDPNILPEHAAIEITGARVQLRATGLVNWAGQNIKTRVLQDGDLLQIGRYSFRYKEKHRS